MNNETIDLIFGKPIEFTHGVTIKIPTVEEVAYNENFNKYTRIFTTTTRELFALARNVDELENKYPTILSMANDEEMDFALGKLLGVDYKGSALIMEALSYWTGLTIDGEDGFQLISSGKILHIKTEWIIDEKEWTRFSELIKKIQCITPSKDFTPPKPMNSDGKFNAWKALLKGRQRNASTKGLTMADKILILSISMESYIPIDDIRKMSIFVFSKLFEGLSKKEAYHLNMRMLISGNFDSEKINKKHWKETFSSK